MFTRIVTLKLKANSESEFTNLNENEIIPLLRTHDGFQDEITFVAPERFQALIISFWNTQENAEAYNRTGYLEVLKILSKVIEGTPKVETFKLSNTTFRKVAAKAV